MSHARISQILLPLILAAIVLALWEWASRSGAVSPFVLPAPSAIGLALADNFGSLMQSLFTTLVITIIAFALAVMGGVALAVAFSQSRTVEMLLFPYAVVLQVTPIIAVAPIVILWVGYDHINIALLVLAWIVAFFPILSNTTLGLRSADHNLIELFRLYGASRWQILRRLQLPTALPYLLAGMKVSGGLALIGTVMAEFTAGTGTATGLAWRIEEAIYRLQIAKAFAALFLLALLGIAIFFALNALEHVALRRWHESAIDKDR